MFKALSILSLLVFSSLALAEENLIKQCSAVFKLPDRPTLTLDIQVMNDNGTLQAKVTQELNGTSSTRTFPAKFSEMSVREGLSASTNPYTQELNEAEGLVVHAMQLTTDPVFQGAFSAGFDLSKVRSAKLYLVDEKTKYGSTTIVEARDASGEILGSFLGGFLVSPCR